MRNVTKTGKIFDNFLRLQNLIDEATGEKQYVGVLLALDTSSAASYYSVQAVPEVQAENEHLREEAY